MKNEKSPIFSRVLTHVRINPPKAPPYPQNHFVGHLCRLHFVSSPPSVVLLTKEGLSAFSRPLVEAVTLARQVAGGGNSVAARLPHPPVLHTVPD